MRLDIRPAAASQLTNLTATPGIKSVQLHWDLPTDVSTYKAAQVWSGTTNNSASATLLATVAGNTYTNFADDAVSRYYWVKAVDIYGRATGAFSNGVSGAGRLITAGDLSAGAIDLSSSVITGQLAAGNVTGLGALALLDRLGIAKIDGLGALATQSNVAATQITGQLNATTQITNLGTLAYANSIAANQIGVGTLAAGVIYAGVINASQINAGTMSAAYISGGTISGVSINIGPSGDFQVSSAGVVSARSPILSTATAGNLSNPGAACLTASSSGAGGAIQVNGGSGNAISITGGSYGINQSGGGANWLDQLNPNADNGPSLGGASFRWAQVYSATATINTSDERCKQQIRPLLDAERAVALRLKGLVRMFKFNDAVAEKGDDARWHAGVIAQEVIDAFIAEGLDAEHYGVLCHDVWDDTYRDYPQEVEVLDLLDEEGRPVVRELKPARRELVAPAGDRYGVRYEELLTFIIAAM